jgi:hypothetical protein
MFMNRAMAVVSDPHHFDADPYASFHYDVDLDPAFLYDANPDTACLFDGDPVPAFLCGSGSSSKWCESAT